MGIDFAEYYKAVSLHGYCGKIGREGRIPLSVTVLRYPLTETDNAHINGYTNYGYQAMEFAQPSLLIGTDNSYQSGFGRSFLVLEQMRFVLLPNEGDWG
jgi:hypothetical protein